ncbi:MAG: gliding motility-associated ABC transporter ATP-binding subunit GldA [Flavobacteriales bacterium]|nr:gliding motility-associated ABC transporter ATP-binding subunit GldA [Flavobacteriales bacterium]
MALSLKNITKIYNGQKALDNISFEINRGEIVGFLGPNGAGKTTTMKIISCFIPSTNGEARVCDIDVNKKPLEVKKKVGYLPENNPLYTEMYVKEFLLFIAAVHEIKNKKERVEQMIKLVGLEKEQHKKIEMLSKGYRQRIGLAQAMIHNPEVLILDEPTSGLDPNQLVEIRKLIKEFGKEKTVLLSTHIMQEVEAICDRVIIIKDGKIVADEGVDTIQKANQSVQVIQVEFDKEVLEKNLKAINEVSRIKNIGANSWLIESKSKSDLRASIAKFAAKKGLLTLTLKKEEDKLEDIFKKLTK